MPRLMSTCTGAASDTIRVMLGGTFAGTPLLLAAAAVGVVSTVLKPLPPVLLLALVPVELPLLSVLLSAVALPVVFAPAVPGSFRLEGHTKSTEHVTCKCRTAYIRRDSSVVSTSTVRAVCHAVQSPRSCTSDT